MWSDLLNVSMGSRRKSGVLGGSVCRRLIISMGIALLPGASGADGPQVKPVGEATIVDAAGKKVGSILGIQGGLAEVLVEIEARIFSLNVTKDRLLPTGPFLVFATPNCSGTPFLFSAFPNGLVTPSTIGPPGNSLYIEDSSAIPQLITVLSVLTVPPTGPVSCLTLPPPPPGVPPPGPALLVPAVRLVDLNLSFAPPFSIRTTP